MPDQKQSLYREVMYRMVYPFSDPPKEAQKKSWGYWSRDEQEAKYDTEESLEYAVLWLNEKIRSPRSLPSLNVNACALERHDVPGCPFMWHVASEDGEKHCLHETGCVWH